jgi:hypothetical protein
MQHVRAGGHGERIIRQSASQHLIIVLVYRMAANAWVIQRYTLARISSRP